MDISYQEMQETSAAIRSMFGQPTLAHMLPRLGGITYGEEKKAEKKNRHEIGQHGTY